MVKELSYGDQINDKEKKKNNAKEARIKMANDGAKAVCHAW